ncbi:hypothetical protein HFU84_07005 [Acidithiobacillus sp. CV18-2]|nr:hypothetical protein [Acidithiobacillus sp. CV18-3]MBU2755997.1 hypothetical protein [Acidithiobacillus sp. BN09-2]MBU2777254.1 hypothetical protein [Acidithiobacillus sp. CV18-2]MBU2799896.1 hypothetical protein [Acidithiobacillus sp. VAN18-4]
MLQRGRQLCILWQWLMSIEPTPLGNVTTQSTQLLAAHEARPGNLPVSVPLAHPYQYLTNGKHLEPPVAHGHLLENRGR